MKFRRKSPQFLLLLSILLVPCTAAVPSRRAVSLPADHILETRDLPPTNLKGTKNAPVDGKDGIPHSGPFVQTDADRERRRLAESGQPPASGFLKNIFRDHEGPDLPQSNDGVMDDPNRRGPADGTRGTEGGVSEKSNDWLMSNKVPDPPKEARPLPHSEAEKIRLAEGSDSHPSVDDDRKPLEVN